MNKYKLLMIICFFLITLYLPKVTASIHGLSLLGKTIVLDAGHGGKDAGAISSTIKEKELNLILTKKLQKDLISKGAEVYLTRSDDNDLSTTTVNRKRNDLYKRAECINKISPDIYISIHLNASPSPKWRGIQVFYTTNNKENKLLADTITNYLNKNIKYVRKSKKEDNYYMYKHIKSPGVLIEAGFISNKEDNYLLRNSEYQDKLINNISEAIEVYFQN